ncbi:hypothetical protein DRQ53_10090, partial [bacterium]
HFTAGQGEVMRDTLRYSPYLQGRWTEVMFVNRSDDTSFDYTATPYSSVPFNYDGNINIIDDDSDVDLFLTNPLGFAGLMENTATVGTPDVRQLNDRRTNEFAEGETPEGARGACVADFDNDGDLELFIASETGPRLYNNTGSTAYFFAVISDSLFTAKASDSWAGAWGDFDRDGWVDLYIARAGTSSGAPSGALADHILRNMGGEWLKDVSADLSLTGVTSTTSTGAAWADADGDGELDVFVSAVGTSEASKLLIQSIAVNPSTYEYEHTFADSSAYIPSSLDSIAGASWRDLNNDGDLDLLLSGTGSTSAGSRILWNDGSGDLTSTTLIDGGFASKGHELLDGDLDGSPDILLASASAARAPGYFRNMNDEAEPTFEDYTGFAGVGVDSAYAITALTAADIAGASDTPDGDEDLYIGRASSSDAFFYQNAQGGTDAPTNKWLKVKLDPDNRPHNGSAIGVTVKAQTTLAGSVELIQTQVVDGGRGVGGQGAAELTFGLRNTTDSVDLTITWPDGYVQTENVANGNLGTTITIEDDHTAGLDGSSPDAYVIINPSQDADWVFEWETDYLCDPSLDVVVIDGGGNRGACPAISTTLTAASNNVKIEMFALPGGGYLHRLTWEDQSCNTPCNYDFTASSSVASGVTGTSGWNTLSIAACAN